jgi:polyphosphate kinase 2 (PPK2 family)
MSRLDQVDLTVTLPKKEAADRLDAAQRRLLYLRLVLGGQLGDHRLGPPLCVVFEGWDASGKGGAIKRLVHPLDPRHVRVAQFAAPTHDEKRHHFLWRFWRVLPGWGGMAVLDRSWYGRVLVERVENFATEEQWSRAYGEIVEFEETLAADEDWRNREKRPGYEAAVADLLDRTDHPRGPWHVVPSDDKRYARVAVAETVCAAVEAELRARGYDLTEPAVPDPDVD